MEEMMKRALKIVSIAAVTALLLIVLAGCSQTAEIDPTLTLSNTEAAVNVSSITTVTAEAADKLGEKDTLSVASSDETVAEAVVGSDGKTVNISGTAPGTATITVTSGSGKSAECAVTVSNIEVLGTWIYYGGDYSYRLEIENDSIQFYSGTEAEIATTTNLTQECTIVRSNNSVFNGGEEESTDCGYAVLLYTTPSVWIPSAQDKFGILRWAGYDSAPDPDVMWFSEGTYDPDGFGGNDPIYFDTVYGAIIGMTVDSGAFQTYPTFYSEAEKQ